MKKQKRSHLEHAGMRIQDFPRELSSFRFADLSTC